MRNRATPDPTDWKSRLERLLHVLNDPDSHVEPDSNTFHPSQLARCKRQATISKLGLEELHTRTLGIFRTGTLIHEFLESGLPGRPGVHQEIPIEKECGPHNDRVVVTGHADVYDEHQNVVYNWKTCGGWHKFNPPSERYLDHRTLYMDALDADAGQVVYINKKDMEVRTWPPEDTVAFDPARRDTLLAKAREIRDGPEATGVINSVADVPFEPCGCWLCNKE